MKRRIPRLATTVLVSGGLGLAALGLGAGIANAGGPYQWCPGQGMPNDDPVVWDMSVCHTWYAVHYGQGNVPYADGRPSYIWDGDNPPGPPPQPWTPLPGL